MSGIRIKASGVSETGIVRSANEDAMALRSEAGLWVVADGMGGLLHGQWASNQVIAPLLGVALDGDGDAGLERVGSAIQEANLRIFSAGRQAGAQIGSTVAALRIVDSRFGVMWAGDSRVYLCRGGKLMQLTRDHTQVQDLVEAGWLAREDAKHHPNAHILSRAVGVEPELKLDVVTGTVKARDVFLLCSDGLTCVVADDEISERLKGFQPDTATRCLVDLALARGAPDNITVIAVACEEVTRVLSEAEIHG